MNIMTTETFTPLSPLSLSEKKKLLKSIHSTHNKRLNTIIRNGNVTIMQNSQHIFPYSLQYGHTDTPEGIHTTLDLDTMLTICSPNTDIKTIQHIIQDKIVCLIQEKKQP